jgi:hypothetical protein
LGQVGQQRRFSLDQFDALVYLTALEGKSIPEKFRNLLLPSTLYEILRETYDQGHDDEAAVRRVTGWGGNVQQMRQDETTREAILSRVIRPHAKIVRPS